MPADLRCTIKNDDGEEEVIEISISDVMEDLTGEETIAVENFLGGWSNFDESGGDAKSVVLLYYFARRGKDPKVKLKDVLQEKGLFFGDKISLQDLDENGNVKEPGADEGPPAEGGETPSTP